MEPFAFDSTPIKWKFMQDNDPKHSSNLVKKLVLFGTDFRFGLATPGP